MTVDQLSDYLKQHWPVIREQLLNGTSRAEAGAAGGKSSSRTEEASRKLRHSNRVGSDRTNGGEVEAGASGGPAIPSGFLRVSSGEVQAGCGGTGAQAMLAL